MTTLNCAHGVSLNLDKGHSCFECEKHSVAIGLPLSARIVDIPTLEAARHAADIASGYATPPTVDAPAQVRTMWDRSHTRMSDAGLARLWDAIRGSGAPTDINGDTLLAQDAGEAANLRAELKALQAAFLDVRQQLAEVTADRDTFAEENFRYVRSLDIAHGMYARASARLLSEQADHVEARRALATLREIVTRSTPKR